ncbi:Spore coat polysaccharide biosynthesis protein SpsG, predicted glycosyltransferase [Gracilibacillus orientalis]|uniref:Spore coat polysaccharide biosynthesis protein SpsG, predicted glycosyltransferase n=1 Tax=Gracilibacillus orientalis TaxID=334253 RepID=A0A1I4P778_9BACI|nr:bifunctional UDP-2,4-diacetamido-2,4,6-trideoxy-beta-L-altropyranose hydrolase/GNAT family N-acetyltransferase [Gracilibacillus orientalis]SFM23559.1 Spore coat polysaccharide biosynthesis protein SpsG, predicted glycosyltransferase [Gracilibacillus orientalis]
MRVLIFTEGGSKSGYGHIIRCSSIYEELKALSIEVHFMICGDVKPYEMLQNIEFEVVNWYSHAYLKKFIKKDDYCIIDSYIAEQDIYELISYLAKKCLYLDDYYRLKYPKGTVITPSLEKRVYVENSTHYIAGPNVICLRRSFTDIQTRCPDEKISNVLITLGGSNLRSLILKISNHFCDRYSTINFNLVVDQVEQYQAVNKKYKNLTIYSNISADRMKQLMETADLAITGSGQTIYELLATGTPFIPLKVAENQQSIINSLLKLKVVDYYFDPNDEDDLKDLMIYFENIVDSSIKIKQNYNIIDLSGIKNIVNYLLIDHEIDDNYRLRNVKKEDIYQVYNLSNDPTVRYFSLNQREISWANHTEWFSKVRNDQNYLFLIIEDINGNFVGQIRFEIDEENASISISFNEEHRGKGLGLTLLFKSIKKLNSDFQNISKIIAYIDKSNHASKKLFERAGFKCRDIEGAFLKYELLVGA